MDDLRQTVLESFLGRDLREEEVEYFDRRDKVLLVIPTYIPLSD